MFNRTDLQKINFDDFHLRCYRGLYCTIYYPYAFDVPDSEECIRISRAPKLANDSGLKFWLAAELQDDWSNRERYFKPYVFGSDFKALTENEFNDMVLNQCRALITKPNLPLNNGKFVGALAMSTMEREFIVDLFAEYEDEFLHFIWETTA